MKNFIEVVWYIILCAIITFVMVHWFGGNTQNCYESAMYGIIVSLLVDIKNKE